MTQSQYELHCRNKKSEAVYYTEEEIADKCSNLCRKYHVPICISRENWFETQMEVAEYLGLDWVDLYNKGLNIENVFYSLSLQEAR